MLLTCRAETPEGNYWWEGSSRGCRSAHISFDLSSNGKRDTALYTIPRGSTLLSIALESSRVRSMSRAASSAVVSLPLSGNCNNKKMSPTVPNRECSGCSWHGDQSSVNRPVAGVKPPRCGYVMSKNAVLTDRIKRHVGDFQSSLWEGPY